MTREQFTRHTRIILAFSIGWGLHGLWYIHGQEERIFMSTCMAKAAIQVPSAEPERAWTLCQHIYDTKDERP